MNSTVCVDKIVDNTEQPLNQDSQSKQSSLSKQDIQWGKQTDIVNMKSTICVDKIVDNTEKPLTPRQWMQTRQSF